MTGFAAWVVALYAAAIFLAGVCVGLGITSGIARRTYHAGYDCACQRLHTVRQLTDGRRPR